jgi:Matrixin
VSGATGLRLVMAGSTTEPPDYDRTQRELRNGLPGAGRAPVLVAWTTPTDIPPLKGSIIGRGGPVIQLGSPLDQEKYIGGTIYLDGPQIASLLRRPDGHARARAVVMHELSHLVGLAHLDNTAQIMHPTRSTVTEFGKGDLEGLRLLSGGGCPHPTGS